MSREERHTAHLRKKRTQKSAKKASDERERVMAKFDPKVRAAVEKKNTMKALAENRNVTIVKGTSKKWKHNLASTLMDKKEGKK